MRFVLKALAAIAALTAGQMLISVPAFIDAPWWVRLPLSIPGVFLIAWGLTGRISREWNQ